MTGNPELKSPGTPSQPQAPPLHVPEQLTSLARTNTTTAMSGEAGFRTALSRTFRTMVTDETAPGMVPGGV